MSATIRMPVLRRVLPGPLAAFVEKKAGGDSVDAATLRDVISMLRPQDPARSTVQRFLSNLESTDRLMLAARQGEVELDPFEAFVLSRRDGSANLDLPEKESRLLDALTQQHHASPPVLRPAATPEAAPTVHPLDQQLSDLILAPPSFVHEVLSGVSARLEDGAWAQSPNTRATAKKLAAAGIPTYSSIFEKSGAPGVVVIDQVTRGLDPLLSQHSAAGRRPLMIVHCGAKPLSDEAQAHLLSKGVAEIVHLSAGQLGKTTAVIRDKVLAWTEDQASKTASAAEAARLPVSHPGTWGTLSRLHHQLQSASGAVLVHNPDDPWLSSLAEFAAKITGQPTAVYDPGTQTDVGAYLSEAQSGTLLIQNVERLSPSNQARLYAYLVQTTPRHGPRQQRIIAADGGHLDRLVAAGAFDPRLARLLRAAEVKFPRLTADEMVSVAQALVNQATAESEQALRGSLLEPAIIEYLRARPCDSLVEVRDLVERILDTHDRSAPLTVDALRAQDQSLEVRAQRIHAVWASAFEEAPDDAVRVRSARMLEVTVQSPRSAVQTSAYEQAEAVMALLAGAGNPVERVSAERVDEALLARIAALGAPDAPPLRLVVEGMEQLPREAQVALNERLEALFEQGRGEGRFSHLTYVLMEDPLVLAQTGQLDRSWLARLDGFISMIPSTSEPSGADATHLPAPPRRRRSPDPALEREQARETLALQLVAEAEDRVARGLGLGELAARLSPESLAALEQKLWSVRFERWPAEIETRAAKGEDLEQLIAEYRAAAMGLGQAPDEERLSKARQDCSSSRLRDWPAKIRAAAENGRHFDVLLEELRNAAAELPGSPSLAALGITIETLKERIRARAVAGQSFESYERELRRVSESLGAPLNKAWLATQWAFMHQKRDMDMTSQLEGRAAAGESYEALEAELRRSKQRQGLPFDEAWLTQQQAIQAAACASKKSE